MARPCWQTCRRSSSSYNGAGEPSIGSTPLGDLQALVPTALLSQLTVDQATIDRLVKAGIQHIQISNTPSGLRILVNGQPLPTLVWDAKSLDTLLQLLEPIEPTAVATLGSLLDTTTNLGVGVVIQLPVPPGAAAIPLIVIGAESNAAAAEAAQQAFVTRAGGAPVVRIPVQYADDGTWTVQGLTDTEWQALTGIPFGYIRLNPELIAGAVNAGINQVIVWTDRDGIHMTLGDRELPYLRWGDGGIQTLIDLAMRLGVIQEDGLPPAMRKTSAGAVAAGTAVYGSPYRRKFPRQVRGERTNSVAQCRPAQAAQAGNQGGQFLQVEACQPQCDGAFRVGIGLYADTLEKGAKASLQVEEDVLDGAGVSAAHSILGVDHIQAAQYPQVAAVALRQRTAR